MNKKIKGYFFIFAMFSLLITVGFSLFFNLGFLALGYCYILTCLPIIIFRKDYNLKISSEISSIILAIIMLIYYYFVFDKAKVNFQQLERAYISIGLLIGLNAITNTFILLNASKMFCIKTLEEINNKVKATREKVSNDEM